MKNLLLVTAVICSALVAVRANPVPEARPDPEPKTDIELMKIPLEGDKELDVITLVDSGDQKINERNKRTIGILRELFPTISQILDQKIQMITSYLFRTIGPILLRSGLGGGAGGDNAGSRGSTDDDFDDDFDDDDDDKNISSDNGRKITTNENLNTLESLDLAGLSDAMNAIRVARATDQDTKSVGDADDQNGAESSAKSSALDELTLDSEGNDEDRNKRFLSFGGSSGGAGGSGNFLFDIIRQTADRAARAAGTVYRVVAGTESLDNTKNSNNNDKDDGRRLSTTSSSSSTSSSHSALVSGSSGTEQSDEKANSPDDHELGKGDGYTEGIPGPVTRLFVLANRGLSNLIQDLILRIAQTSERVVNFKARLITSLI
ncbi:dentin sialophosphoprotein isoform X2 [Culex pipiens pallens]|nr:dentin sialophosphoprotein isoform X2 [Culex pipiens pallens]